MLEIKGDDYTPVIPGVPEEGLLVSAVFVPGAHKHGYIIRLTEKETAYLIYRGCTLNTNMWYKKGDYFEILSSNGSVMDPIAIGKMLQEGGL